MQRAVRLSVLLALLLPGIMAFPIVYAHLLWPPSRPPEGRAITFSIYNIAPTADLSRVVEVIREVENRDRRREGMRERLDPRRV